MRGKSEDQSVGAPSDPEIASVPSNHGARARSGVLNLVSLRGRASGVLLLIGLISSACGSADSDKAAASGEHTCSSRFVTTVESFTAGPGPDFGQADLPQVVLGPPKGAGAVNGSLDVVTLGNGGTITVGFASAMVDGPGPDFIVFENAFFAGGDPEMPFAELATVEVSEDGEHFEAFPCTATAAPYGTCAGWHPVYANPDTNEIDATDPEVAGGDAFDLAEIGVARARYVRITDRQDLTGLNGAFDLDAVSIVHADCQ
jgi:hypothetical protein